MIDLSLPFVGNYLEFYEIDATAIGGVIHYFAPSVGYDDVTGLEFSYVFGSQSYLPIPCSFSGFNAGTTGAPSTPSFNISNLNNVEGHPLWAEVVTLDGLVGARFTRRRTFSQYTIQGGGASDEQLTPHTFVISQLTDLSRKELKFKLAAPIDQEGAMLPFRQVLKDADFPGVSRRGTR